MIEALAFAPMLLLVVSALYVVVAAGYAYRGDLGGAVAWAAYAVANVGLYYQGAK